MNHWLTTAEGHIALFLQGAVNLVWLWRLYRKVNGNGKK